MTITHDERPIGDANDSRADRPENVSRRGGETGSSMRIWDAASSHETQVGTGSARPVTIDVRTGHRREAHLE
ncbi:hypothetical protein [Natrinema caseinilyticum]|uniref:hypothetical protein n=1 Tax=Natrinema caseinilyticum TaxID=2961570 RepID=UPI0020C58F7A|nr:hypothetical protein [Natrinema caseinilyticum]